MAKAGGLPRGYRPGDPLVLFRRIPGTRSYVDPNTGEIFSEHFVVRKYRPSRATPERETIRVASRQRVTGRARGITQGARNYFAKSRVDRERVTNEEYQTLLQRRDVLNRQAEAAKAERTMVGTDLYDQLTGPNSALAQVLVELGLRLPGDTHNVGESPDNYAQTVYEAYEAMYGAL